MDYEACFSFSLSLAHRYIIGGRCYRRNAGGGEGDLGWNDAKRVIIAWVTPTELETEQNIVRYDDDCIS